MKFCFGTVCWDGYLERYIDIFTTNYITIFRGLISNDINYNDIADPIICYHNDEPGPKTKIMQERIRLATGKELKLVHNKRKYTDKTVMYSMRNTLRLEVRKTYPKESKVFFYFPIDDSVNTFITQELLKLASAEEPTACMFKFKVIESTGPSLASTRPINSYTDIHPKDWGGYCAYNILDEDKCPLYPKIPIPNVAFYAELFRAGYTQYPSGGFPIEHLRHIDSHHYRVKDTKMSDDVYKYLMDLRKELQKEGFK